MIIFSSHTTYTPYNPAITSRSSSGRRSSASHILPRTLWDSLDNPGCHSSCSIRSLTWYQACLSLPKTKAPHFCRALLDNIIPQISGKRVLKKYYPSLSRLFSRYKAIDNAASVVKHRSLVVGILAIIGKSARLNVVDSPPTAI